MRDDKKKKNDRLFLKIIFYKTSHILHEIHKSGGRQYSSVWKLLLLSNIPITYSIFRFLLHICCVGFNKKTSLRVGLNYAYEYESLYNMLSNVQ